MKPIKNILAHLLGPSVLLDSLGAVFRPDAAEVEIGGRPLERLQAQMEGWYGAAYPNIEPERISAWIYAALLRAKDDHPGFAALVPALADFADAVRPFCPAIAPRDYLEILYIAACESDFGKELRIASRRQFEDHHSLNSTKETKCKSV